MRGSSTHGMPLCPVMMLMLWSRDRRFTLQRGRLYAHEAIFQSLWVSRILWRKSSTDSLKRTGAISVKQEVISKDINDAKNSVSRVAVNGIPTPNEPYVKMYFPVDVADFWSTPYLAQLYTYMVCNAWHENTWIVGTGCHAQQITPGDFLFSYEKVAKALKCNQWRFKELLNLLEKIGAITRVKRVGNRGVLIHLNLYPQAKQQVKTNDSANKGLEAHVEQSKPTSSPTPSVKPVAAKNEVMNPSRQISKEILDTPVTEAIKYLFFNKKKTRILIASMTSYHM